MAEFFPPSDGLAGLSINTNINSSSSSTSVSASVSASTFSPYPYPNFAPNEPRVHLLNIFKDPSCSSAFGKGSNENNAPNAAAGNLSSPTAGNRTPTALDISEKLSSQEIASLTERYTLNPQAFANMLVCYPNIREEIVARYLGFFPGKKNTDISKAIEQLDKAIQYRSANPVLTYSDVEAPLKQGFFHYHGVSKNNACVAYFSLDNHDPKNRPASIATYIKSIIYSIEKEGQRSGKNELMTTCLIIDRRKATMKNQDLELIKEMFNTITFLYPNAVPQVLVCPCNLATRIFFNILKPFLDKNTQECTALVKGVKEIQDYVDSSELKEDFE